MIGAQLFLWVTRGYLKMKLPQKLPYNEKMEREGW
jgi:hypothetical protein